MKNLLNKNLRYFLAYAVIIMFCCAPLFYFSSKLFYTEDLDELIEFRRDEFIETRIPEFTKADIEVWNKYNEDIQILPYDSKYTLDKDLEEVHFSKAEGHTISYRILYHAIKIEEEPYILTSRIPMVEDKDLIGMLISQYGVIFIILIASLTIVQRIVSKKLWKPFYETLHAIKKFNLEQEESPRFSKTDIKEFAQLNEMLLGLITNNLRIYKQQKEFIENASHELQTPLAVFQSQLDILLQQSDLTETQAGIIQSLYTVSSRMTRLNKNLLLLARIDNAQFKEMQEINVNYLLESLIYDLKELAGNHRLNVNIDNIHPLIITGNKILLESLINNLIMNAIRHNISEEGSILVRLENRILNVYNMGEAQALDPEKIFRRFSRPSEKKKGNGLGLSIATQICRFHNWNISYTYEDEMHCFKVVFP